MRKNNSEHIRTRTFTLSAINLTRGAPVAPFAELTEGVRTRYIQQEDCDCEMAAATPEAAIIAELEANALLQEEGIVVEVAGVSADGHFNIPEGTASIESSSWRQWGVDKKA